MIMSETFYLYKITNILNQKLYIGITNDVKRRWRSHSHDKTVLGAAIRKYGKQNFKKEVLVVGPTEEYVKDLEIKAIEMFNSRISGGWGYNVSPGGGSGFGGCHHSEEAKRKISEWAKTQKSNLGKKQTPDWKEKISRALKGRKKTQEHIQKAKQAHSDFFDLHSLKRRFNSEKNYNQYFARIRYLKLKQSQGILTEFCFTETCK